MKKLLTTITLSALVGTSASNLKPMFTNTITNHGFKSNQINNKDISITNENDTNPFTPKKVTSGIPNNVEIRSLLNTSNWGVYAGTSQGLYKSVDGINFTEIKGITNTVYKIQFFPNGTIYVLTYLSKPGMNEYTIYKSTNGINFTEISGIPSNLASCLGFATDGTIYAGTTNFTSSGTGTKGNLYKSTNGINFTEISGIENIAGINSIAVTTDGTIYISTNDFSIFKKKESDTLFKKIFQNSDNRQFELLVVSPDGTIYAGTNGGLWKSTNGTDFKKINEFAIRTITFDNHGVIYAGTSQGLYKSVDGINFTEINETNKEDISSIAITTDGTIYISIYKGLYTINPINLLLNVNKPDTFDKSWPLYNGIVYSSTQKIDIKENLVASATLDGTSITIPTTDLDIPVGEHTLILTLKDKKLASIFGGDTSTGQVTYKLWVKTSIDKNKIDYQTKIDDTQLYTGLVSNAGNTKNADIIQTKIKNGTGTHDASINIDFKDILIDFDVNKSFYVQGTVDETTNNFTATGSKQKITKNLEIKIDGTYHLHLVDTVDNNYDSYLELGESNWKLKGTFDDNELDKLKSKLNVTVNLTDPSQKSKALGWLHQYDHFVENKFNETIKTNGKGFDSEIKNQITSYTSFLKPLTYDIANEPKFDDGFDKDLLVKTITDKAKEILSKGLDALPKNLNVNTSNVVNKSKLDNYSIWIKNYQDYINKNKDIWINDIVNVASRGFATAEQENLIKVQLSHFLNNDNIQNYLKNVVWEDNKLLKTTSNDYQQYVELDKLKSDTIDWVNTN
ncbi:MAG: hypothetical protein H9Q65_04890, partial [Spiroplasma ixodetis]|nr:hypothetical protein [Spiroplasma ixodetis]